MYHINSTFFKAFGVVIVIALLMSLTDNKHHVDISVLEYEQNLEYVTEVNPNANKYCLRGAALILSGDYKSAESYMTVYGSCIRNTIAETQMGSQLHVTNTTNKPRMK